MLQGGALALGMETKDDFRVIMRDEQVNQQVREKSLLFRDNQR